LRLGGAKSSRYARATEGRTYAPRMLGSSRRREQATRESSFLNPPSEAQRHEQGDDQNDHEQGQRGAPEDATQSPRGTRYLIRDLRRWERGVTRARTDSAR
jgi:hypothetical protein